VEGWQVLAMGAGMVRITTLFLADGEVDQRHAFEQKEHGWLADEKMCMKSVAWLLFLGDEGTDHVAISPRILLSLLVGSDLVPLLLLLR
jgi:hypothetical protein